MTSEDHQRLARQAAPEWPTFAARVASQLQNAAHGFRIGDDARAVEALRDGIDDLTSFLAWIGELCDAAGGGDVGTDADALAQRLARGARDVREALSRGDFVDAADRIEDALIAELMSSGSLADRVAAGLAAA